MGMRPTGVAEAVEALIEAIIDRHESHGEDWGDEVPKARKALVEALRARREGEHGE